MTHTLAGNAQFPCRFFQAGKEKLNQLFRQSSAMLILEQEHHHHQRRRRRKNTAHTHTVDAGHMQIGAHRLLFQIVVNVDEAIKKRGSE